MPAQVGLRAWWGQGGHAGPEVRGRGEERLGKSVTTHLFKEVQLDFTPEMQVLYMLFERYHTKNRNISQTAYLILLNFLSKIQLDHPVILQELVSGVGEM